MATWPSSASKWPFTRATLAIQSESPEWVFEHSPQIPGERVSFVVGFIYQSIVTTFHPSQFKTYIITIVKKKCYHQLPRLNLPVHLKIIGDMRDIVVHLKILGDMRDIVIRRPQPSPTRQNRSILRGHAAHIVRGTATERQTLQCCRWVLQCRRRVLSDTAVHESTVRQVTALTVPQTARSSIRGQLLAT